MTPAVDVLVVSGEPLWPASHGGRIRTARIVEQLARHLSVRVAAPPEAPPPADVALDPLPPEAPLGRVSATFSGAPRLGRNLLGPRRRQALVDTAARHRPGTVLFAAGYLAAVAPRVGAPVAVDFPDVEVRRMASLARHGPARSRGVHALEFLKARRWEPRMAKTAFLTTAASSGDVGLLSSWGATALLVPNGADRRDARPSPADGPVTFLAGFGYRPNRDAAEFLLDRVWPLLRQAEPGLRLRLVGRQADAGLRRKALDAGAEVVGDPESVERFYREASVVVAPVRAGGGAQVKVTEALAHGRVLVATPFSAAAAPVGGRVGVVVAGEAGPFADAVLQLWRDPAGRRAREDALVAFRPVPTWDQACAPLVDALARAVRSG